MSYSDIPPNDPRKMAMGVAGLLVFAAVAVVAVQFCGCQSARSVEAETAYLGEQLACVDQANSKAQADACRAQVRAKWADAGASHDAGANHD